MDSSNGNAALVAVGNARPVKIFGRTICSLTIRFYVDEVARISAEVGRDLGGYSLKSARLARESRSPSALSAPQIESVLAGRCLCSSSIVVVQ